MEKSEYARGMEVWLDPAACMASQECLDHAPGVFGLAPDGNPNVIKEDGQVSNTRSEEYVLVPPEHQAAALEASSLCPVRAILIRERRK